jgi:hypothetical protein
MSDKKTILLRLNPKIWEEINAWAADEFRSINGQIEYLLKDAVNRRNPSAMPEEDKPLHAGNKGSLSNRQGKDIDKE